MPFRAHPRGRRGDRRHRRRDPRHPRRQVLHGDLFIEATGVSDIRQLRQEHLARFIDVLNQLPKSYRKSPKDRLKTLAQILDAAQGKPVGLSPTTINRNIDYIGQLLKKARSEGFTSVVMLDPGSLRERKSRRDRDERPAFTLEDIC